MKRKTRSDQAALNRDLIWALLWCHDDWATSRQVYEMWRNERDECGIAFAEDWIGPTSYFTYALNRMVVDGRVERRRLPGKHPTYRVLEVKPA